LRPGLEGELLELFIARLEAASATWEQADTPARVVDLGLAYLRERGLPSWVAMGADRGLRSLPWPAQLAIEPSVTDAGPQVAVIRARAGVAETGSLVLRSGADMPMSLSFLPEHCLCILERGRIVGHAEEAWEQLRGEGPLPRAVTFVTGPSRTADVEQTLHLGAHGPRYLHVIIARGVGMGKAE
jgi:L-lactate dehydrogenase complex protein LldG